MRHVASPDTLIFGLELPVFLALVGSFSVLVVGAIIFAILLKKDMSGKKKSQGLSSAAEIDAEATRDYQVAYFVIIIMLRCLPQSNDDN